MQLVAGVLYGGLEVQQITQCKYKLEITFKKTKQIIQIWIPISVPRNVFIYLFPLGGTQNIT